MFAAVTTQVAWTLAASSVRITPDVLRDARDHVLLGLDRSATPAAAADAAVLATRAFVAAARGDRVGDDGPAMALSPRWRKVLDDCRDPVSDRVMREHFANGRPLSDVADVHFDLAALEAARSGLRSVLRQAALADGLPAGSWRAEELDALLGRLSVFNPAPCPPLSRVLEGHETRHNYRCAVCDRAARLVRGGRLKAEDLLPAQPVPWPDHRTRALVLHLHPDARNARTPLMRELDVVARALEGDLLLIELSDVDHVHRVLTLAAEAGLPARQHVRGVVVEGPGRWSTRGLLGPLVAEVRQAVRSASWGWIEGLGELPSLLPPPPSARGLWWGVAALAAVTAVVAGMALQPPAPDGGLEARFVPGRGGVWTSFDVPEASVVTLVREAHGRLDVVLSSETPADKVALAVGDGTFRIHTMGSGVLVASSEAPLPDLGTLVDAASRSEHPIEDLKERIERVSANTALAAYTRGSR